MKQAKRLHENDAGIRTIDPPPRLEARDLILVRAILESGGLGRASELLHLTASALSHRLADLERRVGAPLFSRVGRRLVPTPAGETLGDGAPLVLAALASLAADVRAAVHGRVAVVRLATECYTCYHWLPQVLRSFEREHPRVEVRIVLGATRRALPALLAGEIDVAIADRAPRDPRLSVQPLFSSEFVAVVAPDHPWAARPLVRAADFAGERLLRYAVPREQSSLLRDVLGPAGVRPAAEETVELTEALMELVRAGRGVAVLPRWIITPWTTRCEVVAVPIRARGALRRWSAVTRRQRRAEPHVASFVRVLREGEFPETRRP